MLSISDDNDLPPNSCFVSNNFKSGLLAWEANMDIQPVINHYKAIEYTRTYLSKTENECSHAMTKAVKEAWHKSFNKYEQMSLITKVYAIKRKYSAQEAVYHIIPEL